MYSHFWQRCCTGHTHRKMRLLCGPVSKGGVALCVEETIAIDEEAQPLSLSIHVSWSPHGLLSFAMHRFLSLAKLERLHLQLFACFGRIPDELCFQVNPCALRSLVTQVTAHPLFPHLFFRRLLLVFFVHLARIYQSGRPVRLCGTNGQRVDVSGG